MSINIFMKEKFKKLLELFAESFNEMGNFWWMHW
jgi:hypothetical protein